MTVEIAKDAPGYVYDSRGLYIPANILDSGKYIPHAFDNMNRGNVLQQGTGVVKHNPGLGTILKHDDATGVAFWPAYASGLDDMLSRALVRGHMANSAMTPVVNTLLSTIVTKIQSMVGTWTSTVRGKTSPVKKTLDLMARAQDSQLGSAEFVRLYMGALLTDNRGAIGSQVPIETIDIDQWSQYGMELEAVKGQKPGKETMFILRMTTESFRENQGIWMVDGLSCVPTGNSEYPYWIAKWSEDNRETKWVLIHRDFGFQIRNEAGGRAENYPGFGQSGTWRFSPYCLKFMALDRQDWEHLINQPMRGVVWVSGLDHATQFKEQLSSYHEAREEQQMYFYPGVFFGGSTGENSDIKLIPWSEPPAGYTAEGWRKEWVDALAASFHLNVTHLEVRLGEGAMTQSDVASSLEAETAVAAMKQQIETLWNHVAPPRVIVTVSWLTDRLKRFQVESFSKLSIGIARVQTGAEDGEEETFTRKEIRALFEEFIGIEIPMLEEGERIEPDKKTGDDVSEFYQPAFNGESLASIASRLGREKVYVPGRIVSFSDRRKPAAIYAWNGNNDWIWIRTGDGYEMLVDATKLHLLNRTVAQSITPIDRRQLALENGEPWHRELVPGTKATTTNGTECLILFIAEGVAHVRFDFDDDIGVIGAENIAQVPLANLTPKFFLPEGKPLEPVTEVELSPVEAQEDAEETWENTVQDEDYEDLL